jgi:hypothetical protein
MKHFAIVVMILCTAFVAQAADIVMADFDSLSTGTIDGGGPTLAQLNAATLGATWTLNSTSVTHEVQSDGGGQGDQAFLSRAGAAQWGARLVLDTPVDIDKDLKEGPLEITFETATRDSTGFTRDCHWIFCDGSTVLTQIEMDDGVVFLGGSNIGTLTGASDAYAVRPWDSTDGLVTTIEVKIYEDGQFDLTMSDNDGAQTTVSGSTTISTTADFDCIETKWTNARANPEHGIYLNDIVMSKPDFGGTVLTVW